MATLSGPSALQGGHRWRLRRAGLRSRLLSRGWGIRGAYAEKSIAGRRVTVTAVDEEAEWVVCRFEVRRSC